MMSAMILVVLLLQARLEIQHAAELQYAESSWGRRVYVLKIPPDVSPWYTSCDEDIGFQYSMEIYYTEFLDRNPSYRTNDWRAADFVWVPQCASKAYFEIKVDNNISHEAALARADAEYLKPVVEWVTQHPAHKRFHGANFFTVYSMDLGRQDFPASFPATVNWTIGTLTGQVDWLQKNDLWLTASSKSSGAEDRCSEETRSTADGRQFMSQDFVINIPSRFILSEEKLAKARNAPRPRLVFFAGTPNSCARRWLLSLFGDQSDGEVMIRGEVIANESEYQDAMLSSKYCLVMRGSSHTNNVRLTDVIAHGCVPVIISDDFHPPLENHIMWEGTAVFLRTADLPQLLSILRSIPEERQKDYVEVLTGGEVPAALMMDYTSHEFWMRTFEDAVQRMERSVSGMRTEWSESASDLKEISSNLFDVFLESVGCLELSCIADVLVEGDFGCDGAEGLWPSLAALRSRGERS